MHTRQIFILIVIVVLVGGGIYGWNEYHRSNKSLLNVNPAFRVNAEQLVGEFEKSDSLAEHKYLGKILAVQGKIKQIEKDPAGNYTLVLGSPASMTSVRCAIDSTYKNEVASLKETSDISIKGMVTGYQKDETGLLGSDIKLNRCIIEDTANQ
jgi:hypothetical protein